MENKIIKRIINKKTDRILNYVTYENEKIDNSVLELINEQGNCYPFLALLYQESKKAKTILELGIRYGRATRTLLYGCRDGKEGNLTSIDWGDPETDKSVALIKASGLSKWFTWINKDFFSLEPTWFKEHPMDLIWVDFDECDYKTLMDRLVLSMHKGSILIMHNINTGRGEKEAVSQYTKKPEFDYEEIHLGHGIGILRKTN